MGHVTRNEGEVALRWGSSLGVVIGELVVWWCGEVGWIEVRQVVILVSTSCQTCIACPPKCSLDCWMRPNTVVENESQLPIFMRVNSKVD